MTAKKKMPEIRFKGFVGEWEEKKLGFLSESYSGGTPQVGHTDYYGGEIPFIRSGEINSKNTEIFLTQKGLANSSAKEVWEGDILYALYGATSGEVGRARLAGAINQAVLAIKIKTNYDAEFITHWLRKNKVNIINTYLQGGQGNLSGSIIKNLNIMCSGFIEQSQIGNFFQNLDSLISLHQRKYDKLVTVKKSMLEKMFPKDGADVPEIRFKGFTEKWERRCFKQTCEEFQSGNFIKNTAINTTGIYPVYGGNGLRGYSETYNHDGVYALIGRQGALCGNLNITYGKAYFTEHAIAVKANKINSTEFLFYLLGKMKLGQYSGQSAQPGLAVNKIIELSSLFPDYNEQTKIASFFQSIDSLIFLQQRELDKLKNIKKSCLEKMFV